MFVAVAEVFCTNAVDVSRFGGASDVDLAVVDELLKIIFIGSRPGLYRRGIIVHGPLADCAILLTEEVVCVVLWLFFFGKILRAAPAQPFVHASRPNAFSHEIRM
jgi:hypothetical protein